jgi:hypothetical protein
VIMVDAYRDITIPFQMSTVEFFTGVRDHLNEGGVMVVNMNMRGESESGQDRADINTYLADTIASVFNQVWTADVPETTNRELFAANRPAGGDTLASSLASSLPSITKSDLRSLMETVSGSLTAYEAGTHIMTNDRAPVEMLGIRQLDSIIRDEAGYYKEQILNGNFSLET